PRGHDARSENPAGSADPVRSTGRAGRGVLSLRQVSLHKQRKVARAVTARKPLILMSAKGRRAKTRPTGCRRSRAARCARALIRPPGTFSRKREKGRSTGLLLAGEGFWRQSPVPIIRPPGTFSRKREKGRSTGLLLAGEGSWRQSPGPIIRPPGTFSRKREKGRSTGLLLAGEGFWRQSPVPIIRPPGTFSHKREKGRSTGLLLVGEGFWRQSPVPETLAAEAAPAGGLPVVHMPLRGMLRAGGRHACIDTRPEGPGGA